MPVPDAAALAALGAVLAKAPANEPRTDATRLGPTVTSLPQQYVWHPLIGYVTQQLAALTVTDRATVISGWLSWLDARKTKAEAALKSAGVATGMPAGLTPQSLPKAPDDLLVTHFKDPFLRLAAGRKYPKSQEAQEPQNTDLALAALADQAGAAAGYATDATKAAGLLQQIRNLADVYARWEAAATIAANLLATQLRKPALTAPELVARMLAFFRTEGDLTVPPEADTLDTTLQKVPLPPGRSLLAPMIYLSYYSYCATYLVDQAKYASYIPAGLDPDPIVEADKSFALTLAGMDILWNPQFQEEAEAVYPSTPPWVRPDPEDDPDADFDWWALNRETALGLGHPAAKDQVVRDHDSQKGMLFLSTFGPLGAPGSTYRLAADSGSSVGYLVSMLTEAAWYLDRLSYGPTRFGPGAPTQLPEPMVYLLYHVGSEAPAMLCSAAQAAYRGSSAAGGALRNALRQHGYNRTVAAAAQKLKSVRKTRATILDPYSPDQKKCLADNWPVVAPVLSGPAVLPALTDYITQADTDEWTDFYQMRENILGYRRMYEFLKPQVTAKVTP
jgi:hypothetical protein